MPITAEQLKQIAPNLKIDVDTLNDIFDKYQINTINRIAGWFSQCGHESVDFKFKEENLNYSVSGLRKVFGKYFKDEATAVAYARNPEKIANRVYGNRMGNGDEASGDGWKYRGRGFIQLTGKQNYSDFAKSIGKTIDEAVEFCESDDGAITSACYFWQKAKCNDFCDKDDVVGLTKRINGGTNGLDDRKARYAKYKGILK